MKPIQRKPGHAIICAVLVIPEYSANRTRNGVQVITRNHKINKRVDEWPNLKALRNLKKT